MTSWKFRAFPQCSLYNQNGAQEAEREAFLQAYKQLEQFQEDSRYLTGLIETSLNQFMRSWRGKVI